MLIIGGLIALAILALLGAVLLVREEGSSQKSSAATAAAHMVQEVPDNKSIAAPKQDKGLQALVQGDEPANGQLYELFHLVESVQVKQKETDQAMEQINAMVRRLEASKETVHLPVVHQN